MLATEHFFIGKSDYMKGQSEITENMRAILIDWLIEVHLKFKLRAETLFVTVNLIDRYASVDNIAKAELQLVGVAAMLIAAKYEEIYPPILKDFVHICNRSFTAN